MNIKLFLKKLCRKLRGGNPSIDELRLSGVVIGGSSIVLPNVKIDNRVIIGAGSVLTKDIPDNSVAVGNPAKVIGTYDDYVEKTKAQLETMPIWNTHYSKKTEYEKQQMKKALYESGYGFDI